MSAALVHIKLELGLTAFKTYYRTYYRKHKS